MVYYNLKALIKAIRSTKTLADERSAIQKESAAIRTAFKEEDAAERHRNVAKLLYIFMLGYPAHFGQIECLKLVASPTFADKRLGYLGIMLLLDENQEVLTLVTNSLKNDMNHSNMYIVGLALCTFANIASEEMSRDLVHEITKLIGSSNSYIRRKAALCAMRIVRKVPDLLEHFLERAATLLNDRNHGTLLCAVTLVTDLCAVESSNIEYFRSYVSTLVRHLKALVTAGYSPEHDVSGITDPFLQVKILRLMRILGKGSVESSETMNDILAQVATNTESAKNVGNAVLYEAVLTILDVEADESLRVMAINILGKFLGKKDNNIRYVALNTLNKVVEMDTNAVQRHRPIIIECLLDGDISIRRRALELTYALVNESNVRVLIRELLSFLEVADTEFKLGITTQVCLSAERFAPNKRWHIDTVLRVLKIAGNYVRDEILSNFIRLVAHTPELQLYTVQKLYSALKADISQESLSLAAVWIIGEYGNTLISGGSFEEEGTIREVNANEILDLLESVANSPYANGTIRQFFVTAVTKLSTRCQDTSQNARIQSILSTYHSSPEVELQQRAVEYSEIMASRFDELREGLLEKMPPPELKATVMGNVVEKRAVGSTRTDKDSLLDLGDEGTSPTQPTVSKMGGNKSNADLLADIFGSGPSASSSDNLGSADMSKSASAPGKQSVNDILGLFNNNTGGSGDNANTPSNSFFGDSVPLSSPSLSMGATPTSSASTPTTSTTKSHTAYDSKGLKVSMSLKKDISTGSADISVTFEVNGASRIEGIAFQAAVPKSQSLNMQAISSTTITSDLNATQKMRVTPTVANAPLKLKFRLKFSFISDGEQVNDMQEFTFPDEAL